MLQLRPWLANEIHYMLREGWLGWLMLAVIATVIVLIGAMLVLLGIMAFEAYQGPMVTGVVLEHRHTPAHTYTSFVPVGKVNVPTTHSNPETWELRIEGVTARGFETTRWVSVGPVSYEQYDVGDYWP